MTVPYFDPRLFAAPNSKSFAPQGGAPSVAQPRGAALPRAPQASRSILDRVFGMPGASSLVDEDVIKRARQQSLLNAGLAIWAGGSPPPGGGNAPSTGQALQAGVQAGQSAYRSTVGEAVQAEQMRQQQEQDAAVKEIRNRYANLAPDRNTLAQMAMEIAAARGDLGPMAALVQATTPPKTVTPELEFHFDDKTGVMGGYDKTTGALVRATQMRPDGSMNQLSDDQVRWLNTVENDLQQDIGDTVDQMQSVGRFLGSVRQLQEALDSGHPEEASWAVHALTMAFGKISDPGSVVREFEAAGIKDAGSLLQRSQMFLQRMLNGTITTEMLNSVTRNVALQVEGQRKIYDAQVDKARRRARVRGLDPKWVSVPDLYGSFTDDMARAKKGWIPPAAPRRDVVTPPKGVELPAWMLPVPGR